MQLAMTATFEAIPESFRMSDYRPERRRHTRRSMRLTTTACRLDNTLAARREPSLTLTILNVAEGGIAATSRSPVVAGERLSVNVPPEAGLPERIFGRVSRCDARRDGWFLAIEFDTIPAA